MWRSSVRAGPGSPPSRGPLGSAPGCRWSTSIDSSGSLDGSRHPRDEWRQEQSELFATDHWIADGNYGGTFDERFARADTVIIAAPSRVACVASAIGRTARNHGKPVQAEGCPERFQLAFYRWIWNYERDSRPRLDAALQRHDHLDIVELTSRRSMRQFLERVAPH